MKTFAGRLKELRMKKGFSITQMAKAVGVSASTYREWEYGRDIKGFPYRDIARELDVSLTYLMTGEDESDLKERLESLEKLLYASLECVKSMRQGL